MKKLSESKSGFEAVLVYALSGGFDDPDERRQFFSFDDRKITALRDQGLARVRQLSEPSVLCALKQAASATASESSDLRNDPDYYDLQDDPC